MDRVINFKKISFSIRARLTLRVRFTFRYIKPRVMIRVRVRHVLAS